MTVIFRCVQVIPPSGVLTHFTVGKADYMRGVGV